MELPPNIPQPLGQTAFDVHVDVFQVLAKIHFATMNLAANVLEFLDNLIPLGIRNQPDCGEHPGMGLRASDVAVGQPRVEADRLGEFLDPFVGRFQEPSTPSFGHVTLRLNFCCAVLQRKGAKTRRNAEKESSILR